MRIPIFIGAYLHRIRYYKVLSFIKETNNCGILFLRAIQRIHWNWKVIILTKVVILTTSIAASDENFVKVTAFLFQWIFACIHLEKNPYNTFPVYNVYNI